MRIAIAGVPRAGKSTHALHLAQQTGFPLVHADDFIPLGWSEASAEVARRLLVRGPYIIEGVAVMRGLRKALELGPEGPCDQLFWFGDARESLTRGQASMATADTKRFVELRAELEQRGVLIVADGAITRCGPPERKASPPPLTSAATPSASPATQSYDVTSSESRWSGTPGRGFG